MDREYFQTCSALLVTLGKDVKQVKRNGLHNGRATFSSNGVTLIYDIHWREELLYDNANEGYWRMRWYNESTNLLRSWILWDLEDELRVVDFEGLPLQISTKSDTGEDVKIVAKELAIRLDQEVVQAVAGQLKKWCLRFGRDLLDFLFSFTDDWGLRQLRRKQEDEIKDEDEDKGMSIIKNLIIILAQIEDARDRAGVTARVNAHRRKKHKRSKSF